MGRRLSAGVDLREVAFEVGASLAGFRDHRLEPLDLRLEGPDLAVDLTEGVVDDRSSFDRVRRLAKALPIACSSGLVLEQAADLGKAEACVVAQALDESQALDVVGVVQPIRTLGSCGRLQQAQLLVVPDRPRRQADVRGGLLDAEERSLGEGGSVEVAHRNEKSTPSLPFT
jgi:hypothetical protein